MSGTPYGIALRQLPSTRLTTTVRTPGGYCARWGSDDPDPANVPKAVVFSTIMPGGHEKLTLSLQRDPRLTYPDLVIGSKVTVEGPGGAVAWQGRIEKLPDTGGYQSEITVEAEGYQNALEDDSSAREIYVDRELSKWEGLTVSEKISLLSGSPLVTGLDATVGSMGTGDSLPALITALTSPWSTWTRCVGRYEPKGLKVGAFLLACQLQAANKIGDKELTEGGWEIDAFGHTGVSLVERLEKEAGKTTEIILGESGGPAVLLQRSSMTASNGVEYPVYWTVLAVYGMHGLTRHGELTSTEAPGLYASDIVAHAIAKWAPEIGFSTGTEGTIEPSSFVIPQLAFLDPTTVAEIVKQATRYELQDWAVWEGPTFYMNKRGARAKRLRARTGPAQLQETGGQINRLWNGVIVEWTDVSGKTRTVGPLGYAGAEPNSASELLEDKNPENPLNEMGIKKWALLKMGTTTQEGAKQVGARFLEEQKRIERSGQAALVGHVEDEAGTMWPAWTVRGGDEISFVDASDPSYRRIVSTSYDDPTKTNTLQLETPPDLMTALLERLSASIVDSGLS